MPPRSNVTSSFQSSEVNNEVICPLKNQDGSNCRKRCSGEKRFRSMQEHIRRAHPEHYISKLPATEESFQLMINAPPQERPPPPQPSSSLANAAYGYDRDVRMRDSTSPLPPTTLEDVYPAAATAAVALAQLHNTKPESDWDSDADRRSENNFNRRVGLNQSVELPSLQDHMSSDPFPPFDPTRPRELLPSILSRSPPTGRSSTLPPIQRRDKPNRPRKSSITKNQHKSKHERGKSKEYARRLSIEGRKASSAEPMLALSKGSRWEDLIEAATSANEAESDRDLTPIPQSPSSHRASLPPFLPYPPHRNHDNNTYKASPLQNALTPPPPGAHTSSPLITPYPTIEPPDSSGSGQNFHIPASGLTNSTPSQNTTNSTSSISHLAPSRQHPYQQSSSSPPYVEIYCAGCHRHSALRDSFACTECISGFCSDCVWALSSQQRYTNHDGGGGGGSGGGGGGSGGGRQGMIDTAGVLPGVNQIRAGPIGRGGGRCPRCGEGGRFKPFQLDIR